MRIYRTVEQEAERLHLSRTKLYSLVKAGKIPARRVGGIRAPLLFIPEEVDAALDRAAGISDKSSISVARKIKVEALADVRYNSLDKHRGDRFEVEEDIVPLWLEKGLAAIVPAAVESKQ